MLVRVIEYAIYIIIYRHDIQCVYETKTSAISLSLYIYMYNYLLSLYIYRFIVHTFIVIALAGHSFSLPLYNKLIIKPANV